MSGGRFVNGRQTTGADTMETSQGLPNSCTQCGTPIPANGTWFARNVDEARSGKGLCAECMVTASRPPAAESVTKDEAEPEATPPAPEQRPLPDFLQPKDNLTTIPGLGTTSAKKLNKAGILTFADLQAANLPALAIETEINEAKLTGWVDHLAGENA